MLESVRASRGKRFLPFILIFLITTALSIWLDIPILRQVLGFAFFTFVPGFLILCILRLNKLGLTEKLVLSVGLSISFLIFAGLLINWIYPAFGYYRPLSTNSLLLSFGVIILILAIISYLRNQHTSFINISDFKLTTREKGLLLLPALFPLLSILGMHIMNATDNNAMLMVLLFLIPAYAVFIVVKHNRVPDRVYAPIILLTSISLVLLMGLRSSYIIGVDAHVEYYLFRQTFYNALWQIPLVGLLDAALSVSILPTIYHSFLNIDSQYFFKILYPVLFSPTPLIVYIISRKYIGNCYAFLASFFFMSQMMFLMVTAHPRTSLAILFFALAIMTLLSDRLGELNKKLLFIVFAFSCIISHYSTAYIFFFILLFTWFGMQIIPRIVSLQRGRSLSSNPSTIANHANPMNRASATTFKMREPLLRNFVSFGIVTLFFALIFFWYSQVTGVAFDAGVRFIYTSLETMYQFFILEARERGGVPAALGYGLGYKEIPRQIHFIFSWLTIAFIAIGVLTTSARYRHVLGFSAETRRVASEFLSQKIDALFVILAIVCSAIFAAAVALPFVFVGYGMDRAFAQMTIVLSPFFVIGGIEMARFLRAKWAYLVILLVLIPFFMCQTGTMHQIFGFPGSIVLNSEGQWFDHVYVHEEEGYAAKWLVNHMDEGYMVASDRPGPRIFRSQAMSVGLVDGGAFFREGEIEGYIFLRYVNVVGGRLLSKGAFEQWYDLIEYKHLFVGRNKIYDSGGSEIWK